MSDKEKGSKGGEKSGGEKRVIRKSQGTTVTIGDKVRSNGNTTVSTGQKSPESKK